MKLYNYHKFLENKEDIHSICKKYGIKNYTINEDRSIDVHGDVDLRGYGFFTYFKSEKKEKWDKRQWTLDRIPLKFRKVSGDFDIRFNNIENLNGCPSEIGGSLYLYHNKLTTLEGCPLKVKRFLASNNKLKSLFGCPEFIDGDFDCSYNDITSLKFGPKYVGGYYGICNNPIFDPIGFPEKFPIGSSNIYWKKTPLSKLVSLFVENRCYCPELDCPEVDGQHNQDWKKISDTIRFIIDYGVVSGNEIDLNKLYRMYYDMIDEYELDPKNLPEEIKIDGYITV
jgi:hypothetical protein